MNFSRIYLPTIFLYITILACSGIKEKPKEQLPGKEYEGIEKIKKTHREIDSINSLKKEKSKRSDSLKPSMATLKFSIN